MTTSPSTENTYKMALTNPESVEDAGHREMIEKANELIIRGKIEATRDGTYEACCSMMAEACELYTKVFGELGIECIHPYMYYGNALLDLGRREHGVVSVDQTIEKQKLSEEAAAEEVTAEGEAMEESSAIVQEPNEDEMETDEPEKVAEETIVDKESDSDSDKADGEEDESNLRHALTIFDIVILICDKNMDSGDSRFRFDKADCLMKKSEILQEFDDFEQALASIQESLYLQASIVPPVLRMRAETLYILAVIFQNMENYEKAAEAYQHSITSMQERIKEISTPGYNAPAEKIEAEVEEIQAIIEEINIKLVDVRMSADERLKSHVKAAIASCDVKKQNDTANDQPHIDMTSRLVRKPHSDGAGDPSQSDAMDM